MKKFIIVSMIKLIMSFEEALCYSKSKFLERNNSINTTSNYKSKCYEDEYGPLGCYNTGPPYYDPSFASSAVLPSDDLQDYFYLFTPTSPNEKYMLHPTLESVRSSSFDASLPIKIIIHGYLRRNLHDFYELKKELLRVNRFNVIVVDWTHDNRAPVEQAIANSRVVAAKTIRLMNFLMENFGITSQNFHIIGHSLGCYIASLVGRVIKNISRITGLDPSSYSSPNVTTSERVGTSDANFVDIVHCNAGKDFSEGVASIRPMGHADFYANGGNSNPGCPCLEMPQNKTAKLQFDICNHHRCVFLFTASIDDSQCKFLSTHCSNYQTFQNGGCLPGNSTVNEMGFHAKYIPGLPNSKFYLRTSGSYPYCIKYGAYGENTILGSRKKYTCIS